VIFGRDFPTDLRQRAEYELTHLGQTARDDIADTMALFLAPKVRIEAPRRDGVTTDQWTPPDLILYNPGGGGHTVHAPGQTPLEKTIDQINIQIDSIPPLTQGPGSYDKPPPLVIKLD